MKYTGVPIGKINLLARRASSFRNLLAREQFHLPTGPVNYKVHSPKLIIKLVHLRPTPLQPRSAATLHDVYCYITEQLTPEGGSVHVYKLL